MKLKTNGNTNYWKWAFLLLTSFLLALGIIFYVRIHTPREDTKQIQTRVSEKDPKIGSFTTTRDQLNDSIATYLDDYQSKKFSYKVYASKQQVLFEGKYNLLGEDIPLYIYFQPSKLEDGSVLLTVSEISAGTLSFPKADVLKQLKRNYRLPQFVTIDEKNATVTIQLAAMKNELDIYVKANTIDLYNDQIIFDIYRKK